MAKGKLGKLVALSAVIGAGAWVYKKYDTIKSMYNKVSIFKGDRYEFDEFDGEAIAAMFSGVMIDLSDVSFNEDEVYLDIYALCSGIRVLIPKDVEVVLEGSKKASGVSLDQDEDAIKTRTLYINYNITSSGLHITDNVNECCNDHDCGCKDDSCCADDDFSDSVEEVAQDLGDKVDAFKEEVDEHLSNKVESIKEEVSPVVEETLEKVEENIKEVSFQEESIKDDIDDKVKESATELNEAAQDVQKAIDEFIDDDNFVGLSADDESEDEFFK